MPKYLSTNALLEVIIPMLTKAIAAASRDGDIKLVQYLSNTKLYINQRLTPSPLPVENKSKDQIMSAIMNKIRKYNKIMPEDYLPIAAKKIMDDGLTADDILREEEQQAMQPAQQLNAIPEVIVVAGEDEEEEEEPVDIELHNMVTTLHEQYPDMEWSELYKLAASKLGPINDQK
jgi:hypothetical protein